VQSLKTENAHSEGVCARCGRAIDPADHFEIRSVDTDGTARLCRLEHIVAWVLRGAHWQVERPWELQPEQLSAAGPVRLVRSRSGVTMERRFADLDELRAWASAGGFWANN
jgi:hypothetical protein